MNETKHTPGPWEWSASGRLLHNEPRSHSSTVLLVSDRIWRPQTPDAHLIAAAPELYRGLRNTRDYFSHLVAGLRCYPEAKANVQDTLDAIEAEFAALAKARGAA